MKQPVPIGPLILCGSFGLASVYLGAYGILRWQDVLIDDVKYFEGADGVWYSSLGVRDNPYTDDTGPWQKRLGPPSMKVFKPLCALEDKCREWMKLMSN